MVDISRMPVIAISRVRGMGSRRQAHDVDRGSQMFERFLVLDAETLFLINDDEAEILDPDAWLQETVGPDDEVDRSIGETFKGLFRLFRRLESRQRAHSDRELTEPFGERGVVLLDQQCRRHQQDDLFAVLDGLERGTDGDFGLAIADVAANQAVHRDCAFHVAFYLVDR